MLDDVVDLAFERLTWLLIRRAGFEIDDAEASVRVMVRRIVARGPSRVGLASTRVASLAFEVPTTELSPFERVLHDELRADDDSKPGISELLFAVICRSPEVLTEAEMRALVATFGAESIDEAAARAGMSPRDYRTRRKRGATKIRNAIEKSRPPPFTGVTDTAPIAPRRFAVGPCTLLGRSVHDEENRVSVLHRYRRTRCGRDGAAVSRRQTSARRLLRRGHGFVVDRRRPRAGQVLRG